MQESRQKAQGNTARLSLKGRTLNRALEKEERRVEDGQSVYGAITSPQGRKVEVGVIKATKKIAKTFDLKRRPPKGAAPRQHGRPKKGKTAAGAESRASAAMIVTAVEEGRSLQEALPQYTARLDDKDRAFTAEIVYGTLRHRRLLMQTLKPLLNVKITQEYRNAQNLILCAFYQLLFMRTPPHAVVASTVGASALCRSVKYTSLINAVLRRFLREGSHLAVSDNPAVTYSFPDWLYEKLAESYGQKQAEAIMQGSNEHAPLWLRVENDKLSTADYQKRLEAKHIECTASPLCQSALRLARPMSAFEIPGFKEGLVSIQDLSAQLAAPLLIAADVQDQKLLPAHEILDCCAAPGGKSAHLLSLLPEASLTAIELDQGRAKSIHELLTRLKRQARVFTADAAKLSALEELKDGFDRILVDAPCSGTGVIRRHPDIKWLRRKSDIEALTQVQQAILDEAASLLKTGGVLLYTTCSVLTEENGEQISSFLERHPDFALLDFPHQGRSVNLLQRLPGEDGGDGFFYARLIKRDSN